MGLFRRKKASEPLTPAPSGEGGDREPSREELAVVTDPKGQIAEQYRRLRNSIQTLNPEGASRTLLVTSSVRGEGKSVATLNLGLAMAEISRMRVIALDGDLRNPSLEDYLEVPRRQGLAELLNGSLSLEQAIRSSGVPNLDFIGAGEALTDPPPAVNLDRVRTVLHTLKRRYDYILIDTPPALAINDPSLLGAIADGILLVVRLGETPRHLVEETFHLLESMGGNILGTCLTGANQVDNAYTY